VLTVIVDDLNLIRTGIRPSEADAVLLFDPDAVLTGSVASELLKSIARR
jgi:hypothetical protein